MGNKLGSSIVAALLLAALTGCGTSGTSSPVAPTPTGRSSLTSGQSTMVPAGEEGPTADEALAWVIATIEARRALTTADVEAHFAPAFLEAMPPPKVIEMFGILADQLPPIAQRHVDRTPPLSLSAVLDTASGGVRVVVTMTKATPRTIAGLIFAPADAPAR